MREVSQASGLYHGLWSKRDLNKLSKLDSCIRESLRMTPLIAWGSGRKVMTDGLITPFSNIQLPQGSTVAIPSFAINHSSDNYDNPLQYKPFRFSGSSSMPGAPSTSNVKFATTLDGAFTSFGGSKHACPGRFFAVDHAKLLLVYMIENYDFESLNKRPEKIWAGHLNVPHLQLKIRITRRESSSKY